MATSVPTATAVTYRGLWPGVDATYGGTGHRLKYEFTVAPGADPVAVRLAYRGAASVALTPAGDLRVDSPGRGLHRRRPHRLPGGRRREAGGRRLLRPGRAEPDGTQPYGFALGSYDPALALVVDPATIVYAGFIGGAGTDRGYGVAVDTAGAAYVTGDTESTATTFPETVGPDLTDSGGRTTRSWPR